MIWKWRPGQGLVDFWSVLVSILDRFVTLGRSSDIGKTVISFAREPYFHSLSVCKEVFFVSTLSVPAFGDTFCRFGAILGSMWIPGETILAPRGLSFGTLILRCFFEAELVHL